MNRVGDVDPRSILVTLDDSPDAAEALEQAIAIRLANALLVRPDGIQAGSWSQGGDAPGGTAEQRDRRRRTRRHLAEGCRCGVS